MKKEFVMRGQTPSTAGKNTEVLSFSGHKKGYAYKLTEFKLYPSTGIGTSAYEMCAVITAGKTALDPTAPDFNDQGLIASALFDQENISRGGPTPYAIINDTFLITQDLLLTVSEVSGSTPVNWQCRFESVKLTGPQEAVTNYRQFLISDE
jgi:hypothetical protein